MLEDSVDMFSIRIKIFKDGLYLFENSDEDKMYKG